MLGPIDVIQQLGQPHTGFSQLSRSINAVSVQIIDGQFNVDPQEILVCIDLCFLKDDP